MVDNSSVTDAVADAQAAGVTVTETAVQDQGTTTSSTELEQAQSEIASDQASQVATLETVATQATELKTASEEAEKAYQALETQVSDAVSSGNGHVTAEKAEDISSGDGTSKTAYESYTKQVQAQIDSNKQALDQYNQELEAVKSNATVNVDGKVTTQNVDQLTYGNSVQNGQVNPDGSFTFSHDMNDSMNDSLGILGTGTLNGKVNFTSTANGDGSTTVNLESLDLYDYSYTSNRYNQGTGTAPDMNYHVYTDG